MQAALPTVSVCLITYNHATFIKAAIESALAQVADFGIEIVIGEDCSIDGTREICEELARVHPDIIRLNLQPNNMGADFNVRSTLRLCRGKYIALLEGDDYWLDSQKLAKQVSALEMDSKLSACCHAVDVLVDKTSEIIDARAAGYLSRSDSSPFNWSAKDWPRATPATGSLLIRTEVLKLLASQLHHAPLYDAMVLFGAHREGDIPYIPTVMGVYRIHSGGMWSGASKEMHYRVTLRTVFELIRHQFFRDDSVHSWLKMLFEYNAIKLAGLSSSDEDFQVMTGLKWDEISDNCSLNPWGLRTACQDIIAANQAASALRRSLSFRLGNGIVSKLRKCVSVFEPK